MSSNKFMDLVYIMIAVQVLLSEGKGKGKVSRLYPPNEGSLAGCGLQ